MSDVDRNRGAQDTSDAPAPLGKVLRVFDLMRSPVTAFTLDLDAQALKLAAQHLDVEAVRKFRFEGEITSDENTGLRLKGQLGASISLKCVVTLKQFNQRIDTEVRRIFVEGNGDEDAGNEIELTEDFDDAVEPLGRYIDLGSIALEELTLSLPAFPRAPDATLNSVQIAPPGVAPLTDETSKPFAALAALKSKIEE